MPILIDLSQISIAAMCMMPEGIPSDSKDYAKYMILNSIKFNNAKFRREFGETIICCDGSDTWRNEFFPYYKWDRREERKNDPKKADLWNFRFGVINELKAELKEFFPYPVIQVDNAEGDDIIGVLAELFSHAHQDTLIVGGDKDFHQLHTSGWLKQWDPRKKEYVNVSNAKIALEELIISGDKGDGIPNIKSPSNTFKDGIRQSPISEKNLAKWSITEPRYYCETKQMLENYERNKQLIDLSRIPEAVRLSIIDAWTKRGMPNNRMKILTYLHTNKHEKLLKTVEQF